MTLWNTVAQVWYSSGNSRIWLCQSIVSIWRYLTIHLRFIFSAFTETRSEPLFHSTCLSRIRHLFLDIKQLPIDSVLVDVPSLLIVCFCKSIKIWQCNLFPFSIDYNVATTIMIVSAITFHPTTHSLQHRLLRWEIDNYSELGTSEKCRY